MLLHDDPGPERRRRLAADSPSRSRERRRLTTAVRRRRIVLAGLLLASVALIAVASERRADPGPRGTPPDPPPRSAERPLPKVAPPARPATPLGRRRSLKPAWRLASRSPGSVSVAVARGRGQIAALRGARPFVSASVVKAMMLVALLRELAGEELDSGTAATLEQMVTYSDNDAADEIYYRLGDGPIEAAAAAAGARSLDVRGWWSETYLSARDAAAFMWSLERVLPRRHRAFALRLLRGIAPYQRWGIPEAAPPGWSVAFKGGWRGTGSGQLVHQMALLSCGPARLSIAVMTDGMPSMGAGIATVRAVARRALVLSGARRCRAGAARPGSGRSSPARRG